MIPQIGDANAGDMQAILDLACALNRPRPENDADRQAFEDIAKRYISDADKRIIVARDGSACIGMAVIMLLPRVNRKTPELYLAELVVDDKYQSQGIGKVLLDACISYAKSNNCYSIRLESANFRTGAHRFYKREEFSQNALSFMKGFA